MWSGDDLRDFARDGYLLARDVIPAQAQAAALARIDALLADRPPAPGHTGHHFYFEGGNTSDAQRRTVYYRLKVDGHDATWRDYLRDELYDFDPVRAAVGCG